MSEYGWMVFIAACCLGMLVSAIQRAFLLVEIRNLVRKIENRVPAKHQTIEEALNDPANRDWLLSPPKKPSPPTVGGGSGTLGIKKRGE